MGYEKTMTFQSNFGTFIQSECSVVNFIYFEKFLKNFFQPKLSADALWRKMFQRLIKFRDEDDPAFHKKMVSSVAKSVEVFNSNLNFQF